MTGNDQVQCSSRRVLSISIISQYYPPDITAAAFRVKETVDLLAGRGHRVTVITARPHRSSLAGQHAAQGQEENLIRTPIFPYKGGGKLHYIAHYASFMVNALLAGMFSKGRRPDVVLATSPPLFVGLTGHLLARSKQALFVLDIRDIWPDSAVAAGQISAGGTLFRLAKRIELWLYEKADLITCVAQPMADYIRTNARHDRTLVIYNAVPESYCQPAEARHAIAAGMVPQAINVVYVGNMGRCQDAALLVRAALAMRTEGNSGKFRFYLIGDGVDRAGIEAMVAEHNLDNVVIDGPVSKEAAFSIMMSASALFLQLKPDPTLEMTIPSKVFDYLVAGKPILFGLEGEGRQILETTGGNLYFMPGHLESLCQKLKQLAARYDELSNCATSNRQLVIQHYTREKMIDRLESALLKKVIEKCPGEG